MSEAAEAIETISTALIVGGGIGGMAAAICLAERGVRVTLIDIDPEWRVYGAGITVTGPTLRAYRRLGMVEDIAREGAVTPGSHIYHFSGAHIRDLDEPPIEDGIPATAGIMRPALHHIMQARVRAAGIETRLGVSIDALANRDGGVDVSFTDGSAGRFDLVVGADSIYSNVRALAFPHMRAPERTGQGCWRVSIEKPPELDRGAMFFGHRYSAGITVCGENRVYLWLLTPHESRERHFDDEELFTEFRARLADFGGHAGWVRDHVTRDHWINYRPLEAMIQPRPWSDGRIVLLGDAVHATTPHLASGAGMAVESAIVLAEELARAPSVEAGLASYEERRFERCRDVVDTSVAIGKLQLEGGDPQQIGALIGGALHRLAAPF